MNLFWDMQKKKVDTYRLHLRKKKKKSISKHKKMNINYINIIVY